MLDLQQKRRFMKKYLSVLKDSRLFHGVALEEIESVLECLGAGVRTCRKGEYVIRQGETLQELMVLLKGNLYIQREDFWGNRSIVNQISVGEMFGEAYAAPDSEGCFNDVVAMEDSEILYFNMKQLLENGTSSSSFHTRVLRNLYWAIAEKNRQLVQKLGYMSQRTTRDKLISYLSEEARKHNRDTFEIPFNRQQLADYLSVDRSAMSHELCKMKKEGMLEFQKNQFRLM